MSDQNLSMEDFLNISQIKEQEQDSINSQELNRQVEQKLMGQITQKQNEQPTNIKKKTSTNIPRPNERRQQYNYDNYNNYNNNKKNKNLDIDIDIDSYDQNEKIEYLQFKEQTMIKRLLEIRDEHRGLQSEILQFQDQMIDTIQQQIQKIQEQCKQILQEEEQRIRDSLQNVQVTKERVRNNNFMNQNIINSSPKKSKYNEFLQVRQQLEQLLINLKNWNIQSNQLESTKFTQLKLSHAINFQESSNKKQPQHQYQYQYQVQNTASKSPLKELNRFLQLQSSESKMTNRPQDLDQFIQTLRSIRPNIRKSPQQGELRMAKFSIEQALTQQSYKFLRCRC